MYTNVGVVNAGVITNPAPMMPVASGAPVMDAAGIQSNLSLIHI